MYSRGLDILYSPRELEIEHLPGDPVVLGLGGGGHVDGHHGGRARRPGVHSLRGVHLLYTVVQVGREVRSRKSLAAIVGSEHPSPCNI